MFTKMDMASRVDPELYLNDSPCEPSDGRAHAEKQHCVDETALSSKDARGVSARPHKKETKASRVSVWLILAYLVGFSVLLSHCQKTQWNTVNEGAAIRLLADHGSHGRFRRSQNPFYVEGDLTSLGPEELAWLCSEVGGWAPPTARATDGANKTSPLMAGSTSKSEEENLQAGSVQVSTNLYSPFVGNQAPSMRDLDNYAWNPAYPSPEIGVEQLESGEILEYGSGLSAGSAPASHDPRSQMETIVFQSVAQPSSSPPSFADAEGPEANSACVTEGETQKARWVDLQTRSSPESHTVDKETNASSTENSTMPKEGILGEGSMQVSTNLHAPVLSGPAPFMLGIDVSGLNLTYSGSGSDEQRLESREMGVDESCPPGVSFPAGHVQYLQTPAEAVQPLWAAYTSSPLLAGCTTAGPHFVLLAGESSPQFLNIGFSQPGPAAAQPLLVDLPSLNLAPAAVPLTTHVLPIKQPLGALGHNTQPEHPVTAEAKTLAPASVEASNHAGEGTSTPNAETRPLLVPAGARDPNTKHPFIRLPTLGPKVKPGQLVSHMKFCLFRDQPIVNRLKVVRSILSLPVLHAADANLLIFTTAELAVRALTTMRSSAAMLRPSMAVRALGRRFLVFNTVHSVLAIVGSHSQLESLWDKIIRYVPTTYTRDPPEIMRGKNEFLYFLAKQLEEALSLYKRGSEPSEEQIIEIKRKLFCSDYSPGCFRSSPWDPWRADDAQYRAPHDHR
ncbi:hypothetical protein, conserved [Eimeria tenella]|uniref:Uncharacterized protein n=1 Tax=Eimeria tenella TaxID=5802 RepID=U6L3D2_EIMTE|nr:hypothetical protein, conserved [Eimeria tenella]CDJ43114.1 hypothetical protein, conserved [Eimeria tenella]|eukprot:XP_013233864.1 hypothetical protein, conserved [Eimeria tenella]